MDGPSVGVERGEGTTPPWLLGHQDPSRGTGPGGARVGCVGDVLESGRCLSFFTLKEPPVFGLMEPLWVVIFGPEPGDYFPAFALESSFDSIGRGER